MSKGCEGVTPPICNANRGLQWEWGSEQLEDSLGKLVKFNGRSKTATSRANRPGGAQILIFTGVRYERGTPQPPNTRLDPTRPKRKRG
jgi:hypothetical protein